MEQVASRWAPFTQQSLIYQTVFFSCPARAFCPQDLFFPATFVSFQVKQKWFYDIPAVITYWNKHLNCTRLLRSLLDDSLASRVEGEMLTIRDIIWLVQLLRRHWESFSSSDTRSLIIFVTCAFDIWFWTSVCVSWLAGTFDCIVCWWMWANRVCVTATIINLATIYRKTRDKGSWRH